MEALIIIASIIILLVLSGVVLSFMDKLKAIRVTRYEERKMFYEYKEEVRNSIENIVSEQTSGFTWLASAFADYYAKYDELFEKYLITKPRPAFIQAEQIKQIKEEKRAFKREYVVYKYIVNYYESLFPWLREYVGIDPSELLAPSHDEHEKTEDPVSFYLTKAEYSKLSTADRNQMALNRYWSSDKSMWQIGADYERYIGYLYETKGFSVVYYGIKNRKEDMGRDLICVKKNCVEIVQCKYWSETKGIPIRENHICQLYGTAVKYYLDNTDQEEKAGELFYREIQKKSVVPVLVATTKLSDTARQFADALGVRVDTVAMNRSYPCIKCNINSSTKEKIYHLPFDQQYDNTRISKSKGECYVSTVEEAEEAGFRRAWRWRRGA